jgi:3D (Asp-Asp-Asp) domain-containing protein
MWIDSEVSVKICAAAVLCALLAVPATTEATRRRPRVKTMRLSATAYCMSGQTRSGERTRAGTVAADPRLLPIGTVLRIPHHRGFFTVLDTGSGVKGRKLDIYMPSCRKARAFGRRAVRVEIVSRGSLR